MKDKYAISPQLVGAVRELEALLELPVWLLIQDAKVDNFPENSFNMLGDRVTSAFFEARHQDLPKDQRIAILIDSHGGLARQTYELAMLLRRHCGGYVAVIPRHAKSAATLLTLGADEIVMNTHAEMGPLDAQMWDPDREDQISALDEVQSLERLQAFAMQAMDRTMMLLLRRTRKKAKNLIPLVTEFVTKLTSPLYQGIDVVRYTQISRLLKVAEEYGKRLLQRDYGDEADEIARLLVEAYPEHGFPIYSDEAAELGLRVKVPQQPMLSVLESITQHLPNQNIIGRLVA